MLEHHSATSITMRKKRTKGRTRVDDECQGEGLAIGSPGHHLCCPLCALESLPVQADEQPLHLRGLESPEVLVET